MRVALHIAVVLLNGADCDLYGGEASTRQLGGSTNVSFHRVGSIGETCAPAVMRTCGTEWSGRRIQGAISMDVFDVGCGRWNAGNPLRFLLTILYDLYPIRPMILWTYRLSGLSPIRPMSYGPIAYSAYTFVKANQHAVGYAMMCKCGLMIGTSSDALYSMCCSRTSKASSVVSYGASASFSIDSSCEGVTALTALWPS